MIEADVQKVNAAKIQQIELALNKKISKEQQKHKPILKLYYGKEED